MTKCPLNRLFAENLGFVIVGIFLLLGLWGRNLEAQVKVGLPKLAVQPGTVVRIPLTIGDLTGKDVTAFEFVLACDTTILHLSGVEQEKTLSGGLTMFANNHVRPYGPGRMKVVCASSQPLAGSGVLVYITGVAQKQYGTSSLKLSNCILNAGTPAAAVTDGSITIGLPKAGKSPGGRDSGLTKE